MTVVCGIFGYREIIKLIDYSNPATTEGATQNENGAWVIPYSLERLKKGDASVMYHVSFFKHAVVMTKETKVEMDELVNMMQMNPGYEIKIHGHCNGNNNRRIIALGNPKNYFDIRGSDERPGSAKDLTELRAEAVQDYLIENGIDKGRMKTFSWAGNGMLVGETSSSSRLNDRIEIEITAD
jgi:outer membrane protein OmpA-like peptidoglycan-associated protein